MNTHKGLLIISILIATLLFTLPAYAQYREYYIYGKVVDTDQQPLAKVNIKLRNLGTSRSYSTKTNKKGQFKLAGLSHGIYEVTMSKEGYETRSDEWRFETHQERMQKVEVKTTTMISASKLKELKRSKKLQGLFNEATEKVRSNDFDGAMKVLETMLAEKADDSNAMYLLGICYFNKGKVREAIVLLIEVVNMALGFTCAHFQLGVSHQVKGNK